MAMRGLTQFGRSMARSFTGLVFPQSCFACGSQLLPETTDRLCSVCRDEIPAIEKPWCERCGAPVVKLAGDESAPCGSCQKAKFRFDGAMAAGRYEGVLRTLVLEAKRPTSDAIAAGLGRLIVHRTGDDLRGLRADMVTAIPMHWSRRMVRQMNSPERMAEVIADELQLKFAPRLLRRVRVTAPQASLASSARAVNVRRSLTVRRGGAKSLAGATILLIDDILTTGSTCSEAARALKVAGAARVVAVVAARSL